MCVRYASNPIISVSFQLHGSRRENTSVGSEAQRILQGKAFTVWLQGKLKRLILLGAAGDPVIKGARVDLSRSLAHLPSLSEAMSYAAYRIERCEGVSGPTFGRSRLSDSHVPAEWWPDSWPPRPKKLVNGDE